MSNAVRGTGLPRLPRLPTEVAKAKAAGLVEFPVGLGGTKCGNCRFFLPENSFCGNAQLMIQVSGQQECCNLWDSPEGHYIGE